MRAAHALLLIYMWIQELCMHGMETRSYVMQERFSDFM